MKKQISRRWSSTLRVCGIAPGDFFFFFVYGGPGSDQFIEFIFQEALHLLKFLSADCRIF